jgi:antitoxin HicB
LLLQVGALITDLGCNCHREQYSHLVSPISAENGGGFMFTMPDIPGVLADGATELEAIADGREAFLATVSALMDMKQEVPAPIFTFN